MAVVGVRKQLGVNGENDTKPAGPTFICHPTDQTAATILISLGALGIGANLALMAVILLRRPLRRSVFFFCRGNGRAIEHSLFKNNIIMISQVYPDKVEIRDLRRSSEIIRDHRRS